MRKPVQGTCSHAREHLGQGGAPGQVYPLRHRVDKESDGVFEAAVHPACNRGTQRDVLTGTEFRQQNCDSCLRQHEHRGARFLSCGSQSVHRGFACVCPDLTAAPRRYGWTRTVVRQLQFFRSTGEEISPVRELPVGGSTQCGILGALLLPDREVRVLNSRLLGRQLLPVVHRCQIGEHRSGRPLVTRDVVNYQQQDRGVGAGPHQVAAHRNVVFEVERHASCGQQRRLHLPSETSLTVNSGAASSTRPNPTPSISMTTVRNTSCRATIAATAFSSADASSAPFRCSANGMV